MYIWLAFFLCLFCYASGIRKRDVSSVFYFSYSFFFVSHSEEDFVGGLFIFCFCFTWFIFSRPIKIVTYLGSSVTSTEKDIDAADEGMDSYR